ncbi:MAG: tRNA lysidine(34) synthetase TilS [Victivallales bacterium]|nr:tRNA lysidine(34) synthetase TilS [Victivallales bacterium]
MENDVLVKLVHDFLQKRTVHGRVFVGFSGGVDSTALLLLLSQAGLDVTAVHFQHGIRGSAAEADAVWCEQFCAVRKIRFIRENLAVPSNRLRGESVEEAARRLRLEAWRRLADAEGDAVFLAHHADDALEDLLLRLARGGNCTGLTGLRDERFIDGVRFLRPFLEIRKAQLEEWLRSQGVDDWRLDATNDDSAYRRNAVRNELLPLMRRIFDGDGGLRQSLRVLRQDADYLETQAEDAFKRLTDLESWRNIPSALLPRVLRIWIQSKMGKDELPARTTVERLALELQRFSGHPVEFMTESGWQLRLSKNGVELLQGEAKESSETERPAVEWRWREQPTLSWNGYVLKIGGANGERFAAKSLPDVLTIRSWLSGDRMVPFGQTKGKKLQDIFSDAKIPREKRHRLPLVCAGDSIIWVPGVRRAEFGRVLKGEDVVVIGCI